MRRNSILSAILIFVLLFSIISGTGLNVSANSQDSAIKNQALYKPYSYVYPFAPSQEYPDTYGTELTDGIYAKDDSKDSAWQGRVCGANENFGLMVNLRKVIAVNKIRMGFLQETNKEIYYPANVSFKVSMDGIFYTDVKSTLTYDEEENKRIYELTPGEVVDALYVMVCVDTLSDRNTTVLTDEVEVLGISAQEDPILLSLHKPYTVSMEADARYPDTDGSKLTNGRLAKEGMIDSEWSGRYFGAGADDFYTVTVDLQESQNVCEAVASFLSDSGASVHNPISVKISYSQDGSTYRDLGFAIYESEMQLQNGIFTGKYRFSLPYTVDARYVRFEVYGDGWIASDEVQVFGYEQLVPKPQIPSEPIPTEPFAPKAEYTNIAMGKSYTTNTSTSSAIVLADTENKKLTDGQFGNALKDDDERWTGCDLGDGEKYDYVIDLEKEYDHLSGVMAEFMENPSRGIYYPSKVTVSYSADNINFTEIGSLVSQIEVQGKRMYKLPFDGIEARYVKLEIQGRGTVAIDEVHIYEGDMHKPLLDGGFIALSIVDPEFGGIGGLDPTNYFTAEQWKKEVDLMKQLGMRYIIISQPADSQFKKTAYPTSAEGYSQAAGPAHGFTCEDPVQAIMERANELGMYVFLGTTSNFEWYYGIGSTEEEKLAWIDHQVEEDKKITSELYERYSYHPSFYGFYVSIETCDYWISGDQWKYSRRLYKGISDHIRTLSEEAKVAISPAVWQSSAPEQYAEDMYKMLENGGGRPVVDIVAMQDGLGVGHCGIPPNHSKYEESLQAISTEVRKLGVEFWNDTEIFTNIYGCMGMNTLEKTLNLESKYTNVSICFDILHYLDPQKVSGATRHAYTRYKDYFNNYTKSVTNDHAAPVYKQGYPAVTVLNDKVVSLMVQADERGRAYGVCLPAGSDKPSAEQVKRGADAQGKAVEFYAKAEVWENFETLMDIEDLESGKNYDIHIVMEDLAGNMQAEPSMVSFTAPGQTKENISMGKTYTSDIPPADGWPDTDHKELTDGLKGTTLIGSAEMAQWQGRADQPKYVITLDLGNGQAVDNISDFSTSFLYSGDSWIMPPNSVTYSVSTDGTNFTKVGTATKPLGVQDNSIIDYTLAVDGISAVYARAEIEHSFAWSFISEFEVLRYKDPVIRPPVVEKNYIKHESSTFDSAVFKLRFEEDRDVSLVCVELRADVPSIQQILAGTDALGLPAIASAINCKANEENSLEITGLEGANSYVIYAVAQKPSVAKDDTQFKVSFITQDNKAPMNAGEYPRRDRISDTEIAAKVKINENGTVYYLCLPSGSEAPASEQVKAGMDAEDNSVLQGLYGALNVNQNQIGIFTLQGLNKETSYDIYIVAEDSVGNLQTSPIMLKCTTVGENVALGKKYSASVKANDNYPDTDERELTDGISGSTDFLDPAWQGRAEAKKYWFVLDLEEEYNLGSFMISALKSTGSGIYLPDSVKFYVSDDNINFEEAGSVNQPDVPNPSVAIYQINLDVAVSGRYVKIEINAANGWSFVDECKVFVSAVNKTALEEKIAEAKLLNQASYTPESWAEFQRVLEEAEAVNNKADVKQKEVNTAVIALTTAMENLEEPMPPVDETETPSIPPPTKPTYEITVAEGAATTTVKAEIKADGTATAAIPAGQFNETIARAEAEAAGMAVNVKVDAPADAKTVGIELSKEQLNQFIASKANTLTVSSAIGTLTLNSETAKTILQQAAGAVTITGTRAENEILPEEARQQVGDRPVVSFDISSGGKAVSWSDRVTVSIPYILRMGENPNAVIASFINDEGKLETIINGIYDPATRSVSFKASYSSEFVFAIGYNKMDFNDVAGSAWYHDAVTYAAARGITSGTGNGNFGSETAITRAQTLVMIMKAFGIAPDTEAKSNFSDAGDTYYAGYLAAAKRLGITSGVGNNNFAPDRQITRQEMFVLIYKALDNMNELPAGAGAKALTDFKDAGRISDYAKEAIELFVKTGIISGSNGNLLPADSASRAQFVQILYNILMK